jgi:hypothetical protein
MMRRFLSAVWQGAERAVLPGARSERESAWLDGGGERAVEALEALAGS